MWLIFGFMAFCGATIAGVGWDSLSLREMVADLGMVAISVLLIGKTTRNYCRARRTTRTENE